MLQRLGLLVLTTIHLGACYSWTPSPVAPRTLIEVERPKTVRVHTSYGQNFVLLRPIVRNDSISETGRRCTNGSCVERASTIALLDVVEIDTSTLNGPKTFGASLLGLFGVLIVGLLADPPGLN